VVFAAIWEHTRHTNTSRNEAIVTEWKKPRQWAPRRRTDVPRLQPQKSIKHNCAFAIPYAARGNQGRKQGALQLFAAKQSALISYGLKNEICWPITYRTPAADNPSCADNNPRRIARGSHLLVRLCTVSRKQIRYWWLAA